MKFNYEGIEIQLLSSGTFSATVNGAHVNKPSLTAMRRYIKEAARAPFKEFPALDMRGRNEKAREVRVVGVQKASRSYRYSGNEFEFVIKSAEHTYTAATVLVDSKENRAAYDELLKFNRETEQIEAQRKKESDRLYKKLAWLKADNFSAKKK